jgi:hypothetical protein
MFLEAQAESTAWVAEIELGQMRYTENKNTNIFEADGVPRVQICLSIEARCFVERAASASATAATALDHLGFQLTGIGSCESCESSDPPVLQIRTP